MAGVKKKLKTINSRYSLVVTHPTTNRPAHSLSTAERTGSAGVKILWSYVKGQVSGGVYNEAFESLYAPRVSGVEWYLRLCLLTPHSILYGALTMLV